MTSMSSWVLPYAILTLVVLRDHAFALPQPWPTIIDSLAEIVEDTVERERHVRNGRGMTLRKAAYYQEIERKKNMEPSSRADSPSPTSSKSSSSDSHGSSSKPDRHKSGDGRGSSGGLLQKAGKIGLGVGLPILAIGIFAALWIRRKKKASRRNSASRKRNS